MTICSSMNDRSLKIIPVIYRDRIALFILGWIRNRWHISRLEENRCLQLSQILPTNMATDGKEDWNCTSKRGYRVISSPYLSRSGGAWMYLFPQQQLFRLSLGKFLIRNGFLTRRFYVIWKSIWAKCISLSRIKKSSLCDVTPVQIMAATRSRDISRSINMADS